MTQPAAEAFARAYHAATVTVAAHPQLLEFAGWPYAAPTGRAGHKVPAADVLGAWTEGLDPRTADLHRAICAVAGYADWQLTYTEDEVGRDFLNRYGYFELVGPNGHFHSDTLGAYVAYWGAGLYYPWHLHRAEELYFIVSGSALFEAEGQPSQVLRPGDMRFHASNQPHSMTTQGDPILALILWRGDGLLDDPRMGTQ